MSKRFTAMGRTQPANTTFASVLSPPFVNPEHYR